MKGVVPQYSPLFPTSLQEIKQLSGGQGWSELLKHLRLQRLPEDTQAILADADDGSLEA